MPETSATPTAVAAGLFALLLVASGTFVAPVGGDAPPSQPFDETLSLGMSQVATVRAAQHGYVIPLAEVYYSEYRYAVGYYGVSTLVAHLGRPSNERQFGRPLTVYVSDFAGTEPRLVDGGYLTTTAGDPDWVDAEEAWFVAGGRARTPGGPAIVAFSDREAASAFAVRAGGDVVRWDAVRERDVGTTRPSAADWASVVDRRLDWANRTVAARQSLRARPVSVVVGEDAPTLRAAVERAPPNTTVRLPPGEYRAANLTIRKPITIRGAGVDTVVRGPGNGSVLTFHAPGSAIADLRVTGVGDAQTGDVANATGWESRVRQAYATADSAVRFVTANGSLAANVTIRTPANGFSFVDSHRSVVTNATVVGERPWQEGYMGVVAFRSRLVVQRSTFDGGRDGVYTHRSDGIVVRHNTMRHLRFGVHEMYTSDALLYGNVVRDASVGLIVMTRPEGNALVNNVVGDSEAGVRTAGSRSYVADNVLLDNRYGMATSGSDGLFTRNVLAGNRFGATPDTVLPSNRVTANDFLDNEQHVAPSSFGVIRVWTDEGRGNYWAGAPGTDRDGDGVLDRSYRPTGVVDGVARSPAGSTLARAPAASLVRRARVFLPGLSERGVLDAAPLARPVHDDPQARAETARDLLTAAGGSAPWPDDADRGDPTPPVVRPPPPDGNETTNGKSIAATDATRTSQSVIS